MKLKPWMSTKNISHFLWPDPITWKKRDSLYGMENKYTLFSLYFFTSIKEPFIKQTPWYDLATSFTQTCGACIILEVQNPAGLGEIMPTSPSYSITGNNKECMTISSKI